MKNQVELEKQLAALEGDNSEESRKKRQELQSQLDSAQQSLEETQWSQYISDTNDMLDDLYSDYEEYLNDKTEQITNLMNDMIDYINDNPDSIVNGIKEVKTMYGETTQHFEDFGKTGKDILSEFKNGKFTKDLFDVKTAIDDMKTTYTTVTDTAKNGVIAKIDNIASILKNGDGTITIKQKSTTKSTSGSNSNGKKTDGSNDDKNKPGDDTGTNTNTTQRGSWEKYNGQWFYKNPDGTYMHDTWFQDPDDEYWYYFDPFGVMKTDEFVDGYWLGDDGRMLPDKFVWHGNDTDGWWYGTSDGSKYLKDESAYINGKWYNFDKNGWLKYAKGSKKIPENQLAWTQDGGSELIYRTTDGAMLTPLNRGDMVFTNDMSQRLWEIARGNIPTTAAIGMPNLSSNTSQNVTANNNITIELPNVQSYDDFKREMKNDTEMEKFWQEITIGQVMGRNKLNKNKY